MTRDGLIVAPNDLVAPGRRLGAWALVVFVLGVLVATAVVDTVWAAPKPKLIGLEAIEDQQLRRNAALWDGSLAKLVEHDLRLTSTVRRTLAPEYTILMYKWLDQTQEDTVVGKDGWMFLRSRIQPVLSNSDIAGRSAALTAALERRLAGHGVRTVMMVIPRKAVVCEEFLPPRMSSRARLEPMIQAQMRRRGVESVDLLAALKETEDPAYFRGGTHWTREAELVAAREFALQTGLFVPEEERKTELRSLGTALDEWDILQSLGAPPELVRERIEPDRLPAWDVAVRGEEKRIPKQPKRMTRLALTGTSFTADRTFPRLLRHFTDLRVWNAATPGGDPIGTLRDLIVEHRDGKLPEIVVLETPTHILFRGRTMPDLGQILLYMPPVGTEPVAPLKLVELGTRTAADGWKRVAGLGTGDLGHSGDGVAAVRIRGKVRRGRARVSVRCANGFSLEAPWEPSFDEIVLPLIGEKALTGAMTVNALAPPKGELTIEAVELVTEADAARAVELSVGAPEAGAKGWAVAIDPGDAAVDRHGLLWIELAGAPPPKVLRLAITPEGGGEPLDWRFRDLRPGASVLVNVAAFAGTTPAAIELRGAGAPPPALVERARLLPAPTPVRR